jgi:5'-nucleotidase
MFSNDPKLASPTGNPADYDPTNGFEVVSSQYIPFPIDESVPDDPQIVDLLQPYQRVLDNTADLTLLAGFAPNLVSRTAPQGGDSPMGNLIADAMWLRLGVQTDLSMTNTTGIRTDMIQGPVTIEEMFNIFPFNNTITKMQLSGTEVQEMFDFIAGRSQGRGCVSQGQIAGARVILNCGGCSRPGTDNACTRDEDCIGGTLGSCLDQNGALCGPGASCTCQVGACAEHVYIGHLSTCPGNDGCQCQQDSDCPGSVDDAGNKLVLLGQCDTGGGLQQTGVCNAPLQLENVYDFATSNYLAGGGSGFRVLQRNTTQVNTQIEQRDALIDFIRNAPPCGYDAVANTDTTDHLKSCSSDSDCAGIVGGGFVCACSGAQIANEDPLTHALTCASASSCDSDAGRCVRSDCRDGVASFHEKLCKDSPQLDACNTSLDPCSLAGEECKILSCVDANLGARSDNRVEMIGR